MCDDRPARCRDAQLGQGVSEVVGTLLCLIYLFNAQCLVTLDCLIFLVVL